MFYSTLSFSLQTSPFNIHTYINTCTYVQGIDVMHRSVTVKPPSTLIPSLWFQFLRGGWRDICCIICMPYLFCIYLPQCIPSSLGWLPTLALFVSYKTVCGCNAVYPFRSLLCNVMLFYFRNYSIKIIYFLKGVKEGGGRGKLRMIIIQLYFQINKVFVMAFG